MVTPYPEPPPLNPLPPGEGKWVSPRIGRTYPGPPSEVEGLIKTKERGLLVKCENIYSPSPNPFRVKREGFFYSMTEFLYQCHSCKSQNPVKYWRQDQVPANNHGTGRHDGVGVFYYYDDSRMVFEQIL